MIRQAMMSVSVVILLQQPMGAQAVADSLVIRVEGRPQVVLHAAELRALPRDTLRSTMHHGEGLFRGPSIKDVFKLAGVSLDSVRGPRLAHYALFEASDGYRVVMGLSELSEDISGRHILLANEVDGNPLPPKAGPWQLVVPGDGHAARWIRQVVTISVRAAP